MGDGVNSLSTSVDVQHECLTGNARVDEAEILSVHLALSRDPQRLKLRKLGAESHRGKSSSRDNTVKGAAKAELAVSLDNTGAGHVAGE